MSYCKKEGKDQIIFLTKEDQDEPITSVGIKDLVKEDDEPEEEGLILPNGEINWSCPCLGGMASGPCGVEFRDAFSCFHYSEADPKGSDCIDNFRTMQECMVEYPELYPVGGEEKDGKGPGSGDREETPKEDGTAAAGDGDHTGASDAGDAGTPRAPESDGGLPATVTEQAEESSPEPAGEKEDAAAEAEKEEVKS